MTASVSGESEKLELLVEASSRLLSNLSLQDVLASILDLAARTIAVDAYCIWRRNDAAGLWLPVTSKGLSENYIHQSTPTGLLVQPHPMIFHDTSTDPLLAPRREIYAAEGIQALAVMPLTIAGQLAGTLVFYCRRRHLFSESELKLASAIANLAGAAITTAELYEEQRLSQKRTAFLAEASQLLAASLDDETTLSAVAGAAVGYMADWCTVDLAGPGEYAPRRLALAHVDPEKIVWARELRRRYPPDATEGAARVIRTGEPILVSIIDDSQLVAAARDEEHLRLLRELRLYSYICVPMKARGRILGALGLVSSQPDRRYTQDDLNFAQDLANRCALAIDNASLYRAATENAERERESRTDTETLNRAGRLLNAELNPGRLVQALTDAATEITGASFGGFCYKVLNAAGESYTLCALSGSSRENLTGFSPAAAFRDGGVVRCGDVRTDTRFGGNTPHHGMLLGHLPIASYLAVPLASRSGEVIGGLFFGHRQPDMFTERHERIATGMAAQAVVAMENALLLDSVQRARKDASDAHEQLRNILESTSDAVVAVDNDWRITHANARSAAMAGASVEDLLGKDVRELIPAAIADRAIREARRAAESGNPVQFEEFAASSETSLEISVYPTRFGFAVFGRDVTEKKRFEVQLRQTAKLESLGVLAGGVAHDFNNLLVGILGNATLAVESISTGSPLREILNDVVSAAESAAGLTRQLLAYAGKGRFIIQALNLSDLLREMSALLQTSIPRSVQLRVQLAEGIPSIEGDAAQIQQLLMNLIINGAEAIGENQGGAVTVTTRIQEVDDEYIHHILAPAELGPGRYVSVEVSDTGCGMDAATIARIFDPFFTTKFTGRGLGLAAALGIVHGHRGALKVYSLPGKGSTFKILFPASEGTAEKAPEPPRDVPAGRGLILIVDDEEVVRRIARKTLERYGYQVITAENGEEGVRIFESSKVPVSLVLLDLTMPVMGGEEALRRLKGIRPDVRVVLSSGFNEADATQRFTGKGLAGFIQKPYTALALAERIKAALG